jgi:FtsP/CotA-like multicopper oxidase with cupredoxin domain
MPMDGGQPYYFTINGHAFPSTETIRMKGGETLKVRLAGSSNGFIHPMHIHGGPFVVVARDGEMLSPAARFKADTINVGPGPRYDVIWTALKAGTHRSPHHQQQCREERRRRPYVIIDVSEP